MQFASDPNLYFSTKGPFTINAPRPVVCPLGQVIYAGTKWDSQATYAHAPPPDFMRPTPHHLLVYTLEGEANYVDDTGVRAVLRKGSLIWTRPGVSQSYGPRPGSRWSEFFMWFGGPLFDTWQTQGLPGDKSRLLFIEPMEHWIKRFLRVIQTSPADPAGTPLTRLCDLQRILAEALQLQDAVQRNADDISWRDDACRRLSEGSLTSPSLADIAKSMCISYTLFRKRFLSLTGKTPGQFRSEEVFRKVCFRLMETKEPFYQIAERFGFHDQFHFSRRFHQVVGLSPREFRRQVPKP